MIKKITAALLCIIILFSAMPASVSAESYWDAQADYLKAVNGGNPDEIITCVKRIEAIYSSPESESEYLRLASPLERAALEYEKKGEYVQSCKYYKKALDCFIWLDRNGTDYKDKIKLLEAIIAQVDGIFEVYTESDIHSDTPFFGEINEQDGTFGTYYGMCSDYIGGNQSAKLIYTQFFDEDIGWFDWQLPPSQHDLVEIGWNVPNETYEDLERVCLPETREYIIRNAQWLAEQNYKFIIRFGAEVNCWEDLSNYTTADKREKFISKFKEAFAVVADIIHKYAPNCAMMYSPNDISNWFFTAKDFYPGDQYVDWVGMSSYCNISDKAAGVTGNQTDAWYCRGIYENQLMRVKKIVDDFGDKKPIAISECGFAYSDPKGIQNLSHATSALRYFYTYVNMVFPQVKAIYYFNTDFEGTCFSLKNNREMYDTYVRAVNGNAPMQKTTQSGGQNYIKLKNLNEKTNQITLFTCSYYPGAESTVSYELDGKALTSSGSYPYKCVIPRPQSGVHELKVTAKTKNTVRQKMFAVEVATDGAVSVTESSMMDVKVTSWAFKPVAYVVENGLFNGMTESTFEPQTKLTRGMLVTVIGRLEGIDVSRHSVTKFTDVKGGKYYTGYIKWAADNNIVNGVSPKEFAPDSYITREQAAAILFRYANYKNYDTSGRSPLNGYSDAGKISNYAREAMAWANSAGIINGRTPSELAPKGSATRAEIAKIMMVFDMKYGR